MEMYGEFRPQVRTWVVDRYRVHRLVISVKFCDPNISAPTLNIPEPKVSIPHIRSEIRFDEEGGATGFVDHYFEGVPEGEAVYDHKEYAYEPSYSQEPITSHPRIAQLLKKYGGVLEDGEIRWQENAPENTEGKRGLSARSGKISENVNLMYGVRSYLALGAVYTVTEVVKKSSIPPNLLRGTGTIIKSPPGDPPTPPGRNWLKAPPSSRSRGNVMQITSNFLLSGIGGWIPDVYDGSELDGEVEQA